MGKEEDEDALLYGDVGDSDDELNAMTKNATVVVSTSAVDITKNGKEVLGEEMKKKKKKKKNGSRGDDDVDEDDSDEDARTNVDEIKTKSTLATTTATTKDDYDDNSSAAVYVANLTWWTTDREVEQLCKEFGEVKQVSFFTEKKNGKSKGCALVEFMKSEQAVMCVENLNKRAIGGKSCVVTMAPSKSSSILRPAEPLPPPPDTAWKGPVPMKTTKGAVAGTLMMMNSSNNNNNNNIASTGGVVGDRTLLALQTQQKMKLLMMQQKMKAKLQQQQPSINTMTIAQAGLPPMPPGRPGQQQQQIITSTQNMEHGTSNAIAKQQQQQQQIARDKPTSPPTTANVAVKQNSGIAPERLERRKNVNIPARQRPDSPPAGQMNARGRKRSRR